MTISMIAAMGRRREIGYNNDMLWHIPEDFKWFKERTIEKNIVMGRKTLESIGYPLPNRNTFVLTKDENYEVNGATVVHDPREILNMSEYFGEEFIICGGSSIYEFFLPYASKLLITEVDKKYKADTFFPYFKKKDYHRVYGQWRENYDGTSFKFCILTRK